MATQITLKVDLRTLTGRKIKLLRRQGILPGNVFGAKTKSISVQLKVDVFKKVYTQAGETNIVYLTVGDEKETRPVLITSVQLHPVTDVPLHVDFHQVDLTQKVTADIPVELVGKSPAEDEGAIIVQLVNELEVEALPTDLPEKFEVDITALKAIGDEISVKDLKVSDKVEIKNDPELQLVQAQEPQKEEEIAPPAPVEGEITEGAEAPVGEPASGDASVGEPTKSEAQPKQKSAE